MPIRPETRHFFPIDWPTLSAMVRFEIPGPHGPGRCWECGRPHGKSVRVLPDGRWWDEEIGTWKDDHGHQAPWPDIVEACSQRRTKVVLACCHRDHDPTNNKLGNLAAWCQRHHLLHDRDWHRRQFDMTIRLRRACGDLFMGAYTRW